MSTKCRLRVFLVKTFYKFEIYNDEVRELFKLQFPETTVPHLTTVLRLIKQFEDAGTSTVNNIIKSARPTVLNNNNLEIDKAKMVKSPMKSIRKLSQQVGLSQT